MAELRIGIVGCGGIGAVHVKSWARVEGAGIAAACDADPARAEVAGGGALMDTSVHSVDLFRHLVGEVKEAAGAVERFNPAIRGVEDSGAMLLKAENGGIGVIEASWMTPWSANVVEIYGERGAAVI